MASKTFLCDIELNGNQLKNVVIEHVTSLPAFTVSDEGRIVYDETTNSLYFGSDAAWVASAGNIKTITSLTNALIVNDPLSDGNLTLSIDNATTSNPGLLTSAFFDDLTNATNASTPSTLVKRDGNGDVIFNKVTLDVAPTLPNDAVNKAYIDGLLGSVLEFIGVINATPNPNFPAATKGDVYFISGAGKIGGAAGEIVEVGDMIICTAITSAGGTFATVGADWEIIQSNTDAATELVRGLVTLASQLEVNAGTDANKVVTPLTLQAKLDALAPVTKYIETIGDGVATQFVINHLLGAQPVVVQVYEATGLKQQVEVCVETIDNDNSRVTFNVAPASTSYIVVAMG